MYIEQSKQKINNIGTIQVVNAILLLTHAFIRKNCNCLIYNTERTLDPVVNK